MAIQNKVKPVLGLVLICAVMIVIDSIIVRVYTNTNNEPSPAINMVLFISFVIIFGFTNYIFIGYSRHEFLQSKYRSYRLIKIFKWSIIFIQFVLCVMLALLVTQLLVFKSYDLSIRISLIYITHISAIAFLTLLTFQFVNWFRSNRYYIILFYSCAFSLVIANLLISLLILSLASSYSDPVIRLRSIRTAVIDTTFPIVPDIVTTTYDYLFISSFIFVWIPTIILLKSYSLRFGKVKYWILVTVPVVYFLIPFLFDELGTFNELRLEYGRQFNLIYDIFFSPYRQVGALLFGIVFFITSFSIRRKELRSLVMTSGIGMILLFSSTVIQGLSYFIAPPFGVVTLCFMSLASYMLTIGIFASSKELARDTLVRRDLHKFADENTLLFQKIGVAEMEKALIKKIKPLMDKTNLVEESNIQYDMEQEDYKEMIKEVLDELNQSKERRKGGNINTN